MNAHYQITDGPLDPAATLLGRFGRDAAGTPYFVPAEDTAFSREELVCVIKHLTKLEKTRP